MKMTILSLIFTIGTIPYAQAQLVTSDGSAVTDGSGQPVRTGAQSATVGQVNLTGSFACTEPNCPCPCNVSSKAVQNPPQYSSLLSDEAAKRLKQQGAGGVE